MDLSVSLGRLHLKNPIMVASGTFGYAREMEGIVDVSRLGGVLPKTITAEPRIGNAPWRTVETAAGLLNAIGLDNDGVDAFLQHHLPYLRQLGTAVMVSVAGRTEDEFVELAERVGGRARRIGNRAESFMPQRQRWNRFWHQRRIVPQCRRCCSASNATFRSWPS